MDNLIGYMDSDRSKTHSISSNFMSARLETLKGAVEVVIHKSGKFEVFVGPQDGPGTKLAEGNVNEAWGSHA
jgi:hypothetical protein